MYRVSNRSRFTSGRALGGCTARQVFVDSQTSVSHERKLLVIPWTKTMHQALSERKHI